MKPTPILLCLCLAALAIPLQADSGYALIYTEDGVEHRIVGVEDFKPYYEVDGEKRFMTLAGRLDLRKTEDADPASVYYPLYYQFVWGVFCPDLRTKTVIAIDRPTLKL